MVQPVIPAKTMSPVEALTSSLPGSTRQSMRTYFSRKRLRTGTMDPRIKSGGDEWNVRDWRICSGFTEAIISWHPLIVTPANAGAQSTSQWTEAPIGSRFRGNYDERCAEVTMRKTKPLRKQGSRIICWTPGLCPGFRIRLVIQEAAQLSGAARVLQLA